MDFGSPVPPWISPAWDWQTSPSTAGWYVLLAGCVGAVLAAIAGSIDLFTVVPPRSSAKIRGYTHAVLNLSALALFCASLAVQGSANAPPTRLSLLLAAAGVVIVACSGWLGATLVYRHQIGVDHLYAGAGRWLERRLTSWKTPACAQNELAYGQMMLVHVDKERVVVAHGSSGIVAFSDRCTHQGGPLSDGMLAGCIVQCPWHGSQFDARTGNVVTGPARDPLKTYSVEIRDGHVYVSPAQPPIQRIA